ncbi:MAG: hypothetical protein WKF89_16405 [Chitinophagaceae bacterium]
MKKTSTYLLFIAMMLIAGMYSAHAQSGFFVPQNAKIFFTGNATIFTDVFNQGNLGVGKTAALSFTGKQWENDRQSLITDETNGGEGANGSGGFVRFLSTDTVPQVLIGGYNAASRLGPAFSNLEIESLGGVKLIGSNAKVRNELKFTNGLLYVNNNVLLVGEGNPGVISGYDSLHYVVTDSKMNDGFLLREGITDQNGVVVFPIGSSADAYTPAAVRNRMARGDNYYMNVANGVKVDSLRGELLDYGVNKTWQVGKQLYPDEDSVDITLQHLNSDEGSFFTTNRKNTYVSQYVGNRWIEGSPLSPPQIGNLTTGSALLNSGVNTKTFNGTISSASYFTKLTGKGDTSKIKTVLWFNGYRLDPDFVRIYWRTNPEINNANFVVQRRLSTETVFKEITTVATKSINGVSMRELNYEIKDANNYIGVSFYRLMMVDNGNDSTYSNIIAVAPAPGKFKLILWPNPTRDKFWVGLNGEVALKSVVIWNAIGMKLRVENVNGRSIIEFNGLIPGTYMVGFISTTNYIIETKKLIVLGY